MRNSASALAVAAVNGVWSASVLAQQSQADQQAQAAAGAFACGGCGLVFLLFILAMVALNIALLVWVVRDAKARGMDSAILWMLLVAFTGLLGLVIYLFSRPQGEVVQCPNCKNKRLAASVKCPHCGA